MHSPVFHCCTGHNIRSFAYPHLSPPTWIFPLVLTFLVAALSMPLYFFFLSYLLFPLGLKHSRHILHLQSPPRVPFLLQEVQKLVNTGKLKLAPSIFSVPHPRRRRYLREVARRPYHIAILLPRAFASFATAPSLLSALDSRAARSSIKILPKAAPRP